MKKIINRKNLWAYFVLPLTTALVSVRSKDDNYSPMVASTQFRGILVSCLGKDGKNMLTDKAFVKGISAYGYKSKVPPILMPNVKAPSESAVGHT